MTHYLHLTNGAWAKTDSMTKDELHKAEIVAQYGKTGAVYEVVKNRFGAIKIALISEDEVKALVPR